MPKLEFEVTDPVWQIGETAYDVVTKRNVKIISQTLQIEATHHGKKEAGEYSVDGVTVEYRYVYLVEWLSSGHIAEVLQVHLTEVPEVKVEVKPKSKPLALPGGKQKRKWERKEAEKREIERRRFLRRLITLSMQNDGK